MSNFYYKPATILSVLYMYLSLSSSWGFISIDNKILWQQVHQIKLQGSIT